MRTLLFHGIILRMKYPVYLTDAHFLWEAFFPRHSLRWAVRPVYYCRDEALKTSVSGLTNSIFAHSVSGLTNSMFTVSWMRGLSYSDHCVHHSLCHLEMMKSLHFVSPTRLQICGTSSSVPSINPCVEQMLRESPEERNLPMENTYQHCKNCTIWSNLECSLWSSSNLSHFMYINVFPMALWGHRG